MKTLYVSIGNSDDKLTQREWAMFTTEIFGAIKEHAYNLYGVWYSLPDAIFQNACYAFSVNEHQVDWLKGVLKKIAHNYKQDSIAWVQVDAAEIVKTS